MSLQSKEKQDELTHKIIGCAMEVHNTLGNGFTHIFICFLIVFVSASQFKR
jgi:hypothetical protein